MARKKQEKENLDIVSTSDDIFSELLKTTKANTMDTAGKCPYFIDTGNLALNYMCSGRFATGGIPGGRITEVFGPPATSKSLLGYCCLASCQRLGGISVLLDCERASNAEFAEKAAHLNASRLITYEPISIEEVEKKIIAATNAIRKHYGKDIPILFVWDSIGVSPTEREWAEVGLPENPTAAQIKAVGSERPGERARAAGDLLRKINPFINENNATLYIINQIRSKIGVMFGCFHYNSRVVLADGRKIKIGKIVNQNMVGLEVLSFNPKTNKIENKKITQVHKNGKLQKDEFFLQFKVQKRSENGFTQFACTPNHIVFVKDKNQIVKELSASQLKIGDKILTKQSYYLSDIQKQIVYGSILGDGNIRKKTENDSCVQFRTGHGIDQSEYCLWKQNLMNPWVSYTYRNDKKIGFDTIPMYELNSLNGYHNGFVPKEVLDNMTPLSLAIWYLDDGYYKESKKWGYGRSIIYSTKFKNRNEIANCLFNKFGLQGEWKEKGYQFDSENTRKLHEIICKYVHPSMDYKINHRFRGLFKNIIQPEIFSRNEVVESEILDIYIKPEDKCKYKYDLTIEDNATYIVDGAIVHNSPETNAGGGKALEFYASCRLRTSIGKNIENKNGMPLGVNLKFKNKKSRNCPPGIGTEGVQLFFEHGINPLGGLLSILIATERIELSSKGNFSVKTSFLSGSEPYTFKASMARNDIPLEVLLDNPKLIDLSSREEVESYMKIHENALNLANGNTIVEKVVNEEGDEEVSVTSAEEVSEFIQELE